MVGVSQGVLRCDPDQVMRVARHASQPVTQAPVRL
jgi:hypothetical protein